MDTNGRLYSLEKLTAQWREETIPVLLNAITTLVTEVSILKTRVQRLEELTTPPVFLPREPSQAEVEEIRQLAEDMQGQPLLVLPPAYSFSFSSPEQEVTVPCVTRTSQNSDRGPPGLL